jgi:RNA polymerase sigma-70 factor (ECF subfamily)
MDMETVDTEAIDKADMERLAQGHDAALNSLMERHSGPVFQFLYRMLGDEQDANDLAQETFVRVYRHRERFDGGKFTTWLYTIASNLARNEYRRRGRHPVVSLQAESADRDSCLEDVLPSPGAGPREAAEAQEQQDGVRAAVQELPDELREAIVLCEWEDMSAADAAAVLQTTSRAIESRLYRARRRLKDRLKRWL